MERTSLRAQVCRIPRSHKWSQIHIQDGPNHSQDAQVVVKNERLQNDLDKIQHKYMPWLDQRF
jgi:hypothetical protein